MVQTAGSVVVDIRGNVDPLERSMGRARVTATQFDRAMGKTNAVLQQIEANTRRATKANDDYTRSTKGATNGLTTMARGVRNLMGTLGIAFGAAQLIRTARASIDSATSIGNALNVAGLQGAELERVYERLFQSAQKNVAPFETLTILYGRAALAQKELGVSTEELLNFTDKVAIALRVSGRSASESRGALIQLSQAIGAGIVRAEEFNAILEGALPIAQTAAAGLEEAGGSVARLRTLIIDGKVSSEAFFRAFEAGSALLERRVARAEVTISQGFTRIGNTLINLADVSDDTFGVRGGILDGLDSLNDFLDTTAVVIENLREPVNQAVTWFNRLDRAIGNVNLAFAALPGVASIGPALTALIGTTPGQSPGGGGADVQPLPIQPVSLTDFTGTGGDKAAEKVQKVIDALKRQREQVFRTNREQVQYNALQRAGIGIDDARAATVMKLARALHDAEAAQERSVQLAAAENLSRTAREQAQYNALLREGVGIHDETARAIMANAAALHDAELTYGLIREQIESTLSPMERYAESLRSIESLYQTGIINAEQYGLATSALAKQVGADWRSQAGFVSSAMGMIVQATSQGSEEAKKVSQVAAIAQGLINTYLAATKAIAEVPFPANFVLAAANVALGLSYVSQIRSLRQGGPVQGQGTGTSDSIPARLSNGEFVVNARSTQRYRPVLERINNFADGGAVGRAALTPGFTSGPSGDGLRIEVVSRVDRNGNLRPFVEDVSGRVAGSIVSVASPNIIDRAASRAGSELSDGTFDRAMGTRYGQQPQAPAR